MAEKKIKTKDMIIAIFCTILAILCIVFYFLPAFSVKYRTGPSEEYSQASYTSWEMTKAVFMRNRATSLHMEGIMGIKETFGFAVFLSGILMPIGILCTIATAVFAYLSWLKSEDFKKFCFLFSLIGMLCATLTLICTWFIAIQLRDGTLWWVFAADLKGSMAYASFVSLILSFVVAIIACAYNYFLDNFDEDEEDDDEDEEDEPKKVVADEKEEKVEKPVARKTTTTKTSTKKATK